MPKLISKILSFAQKKAVEYTLVGGLLIGLFFELNYIDTSHKQQMLEAVRTIERIKLKLSMLGE